MSFKKYYNKLIKKIALRYQDDPVDFVSVCFIVFFAFLLIAFTGFFVIFGLYILIIAGGFQTIFGLSLIGFILFLIKVGFDIASVIRNEKEKNE